MLEIIQFSVAVSRLNNVFHITSKSLRQFTVTLFKVGIVCFRLLLSFQSQGFPQVAFYSLKVERICVLMEGLLLCHCHSRHTHDRRANCLTRPLVRKH